MSLLSDELQLIRAVLNGYKDSIAKSDALRAVCAIEAADALTAADKRIAELESSWAACHAQLAESCDERYKLERKLAVAREALEKYGRHDKNCEAVTEAVSECCGCGLDESLAQIGGGDE